MDPDGTLYGGVKGLADCLNELLASAAEVAKHPKDEAAQQRLANATMATQVHSILVMINRCKAALITLNAIEAGYKTDDAFQKLYVELGKAVQSAATVVATRAATARTRDPSKKVFYT